MRDHLTEGQRKVSASSSPFPLNFPFRVLLQEAWKNLPQDCEKIIQQCSRVWGFTHTIMGLHLFLPHLKPILWLHAYRKKFHRFDNKVWQISLIGALVYHIYSMNDQLKKLKSMTILTIIVQINIVLHNVKLTSNNLLLQSAILKTFATL